MREILEDAEGAVERGDAGAGKANRERDKQQFPKRFYKSATSEKSGDGFGIFLDGKQLKTPGKNELLLPNEAAARLISDEWNAIEKEINPMKLPVTRLANTAIDGVANEMQAVMEDVCRFASSDLLCYRAETPAGLVKKQNEHWDPVLDWMQEKTSAGFETALGIVHVPQSKEALTLFGASLKKYQDPVKLACIHTFTSLSGSAILALALAEAHIDAKTLWAAAHVDEDWNISQWGEDFEASERRKQRWQELQAADSLFKTVAQDKSYY